MTITKEDLREVLKAFDDSGYQIRYKNDPQNLSLANTGALQGPMQGDPTLGGAFSAPGIRPDRFSALPRVRTMASLLRPMPSEIYNEIIAIVTGATIGTGTNPTNYCGDPPQPGNLKTCSQAFTYGRWYEKTQLQSVNDIGLLRNRAEVPGRILNSAPQDHPLIPDVMWRLVDTRSQAQYAFYMQGIELERQLEQVLILGDDTKANTTTVRGFIKEFKGLDLQIKTGYTDQSGVLCAAADSMVISFNGSMTGTIGGGDGRTITTAINDMYYAGMDRAAQVGMDQGLEYAWVMRKEQFRALTDVYANTYATSRFQSSSLSAGSPLIQIATDTDKIRQEMLNGHYLLIDGVPVPVVFSSGIPLEGQGSNVYNADMYLVPFAWQGIPLLRLDYFNLGNQYITEWNGIINPDKRRIINNGFFAMGYRDNGFCDEVLFAAQMRLILETPFLAGRIDNVTFSYLAPTRTSIPGTSLYVDGGVSYYTPRAI
jgi:hypothetical protein